LSEPEKTGQTSPKLDNSLLAPVSMRKIRFTTTKFLEPVGSKNAAIHKFSPRHLKFLEVYAETLDYKKALRTAEMRAKDVTNSAYLLNEIKLINQAASLKHRNKSALGTHHRLMQKFEKQFDAEYGKNKTPYASVLAKMSDTALKAAGEFTDHQENTGFAGIQVTINIGDPSPQPRTIDAQVS
jgi:hypothetical protein